MARPLTLRTSAKTKPHSPDRCTACRPVSHGAHQCTSGSGSIVRFHNLWTRKLNTAYVTLGVGILCLLSTRTNVRLVWGQQLKWLSPCCSLSGNLATSRAVSLCSRSRPGPSHPHPAPTLIGGVFHSLLAQHSHRLPSSFCGPPLSHSAPEPEPNSSSLAHHLFLSAPLVTKLSGCTPRPPPVSHKAR